MNHYFIPFVSKWKSYLFHRRDHIRVWFTQQFQVIHKIANNTKSSITTTLNFRRQNNIYKTSHQIDHQIQIESRDKTIFNYSTRFTKIPSKVWYTMHGIAITPCVGGQSICNGGNDFGSPSTKQDSKYFFREFAQWVGPKDSTNRPIVFLTTQHSKYFFEFCTRYVFVEIKHSSLDSCQIPIIAFSTSLLNKTIFGFGFVGNIVASIHYYFVIVSFFFLTARWSVTKRNKLAYPSRAAPLDKINQHRINIKNENDQFNVKVL